MMATGGRFAIAEERVGRVLVGFMALGFLALIAAALATAWVNGRSQRFAASVVHTQQARQAIADVQVALEQSETARRGYLLTGAALFRGIYMQNVTTFDARLSTLAEQTDDNPVQQRRVARMRAVLVPLGQLRSESIALVDSGRIAVAQRRFAADASVPLMRSVRYRLRAMDATELSLLAARDAAQRRATIAFYAMLALAGLLIVVVALVSLLVVQRSTALIATSRDELRDLNDTLELRVAERTADLSRANEEIQRFAYIVSHDLRSPLVNVMGFTAELETAAASVAQLIDRAEAEAPAIVGEEARLAAREDLPEAIGFIRSSTQKMDRLINAILVLSRQGRRVLAPEPLDLAEIVDGARASLAKRLEDEGGRVIVEGELPAIVSDRLGIEQVLSNLIENAVKYRHADRPVVVAVRGRSEHGRVVIEVADNGRGIEPRDHDRVFDLFRRSGRQDQPGEGIGLAHVRALVFRLGGTIGVTSALGEGAVFRLSLPPILAQEPIP